jgi:hypothetical protein
VAWPQVLFAFLATPELHGYPLRCMERKKEGEETTRKKFVAAVVVPLARPVQGDEMEWKEGEEGRQSRRERANVKGKKRERQGSWATAVISSHPTLWLSLALSARQRQPSRRLCGSLHTSSARTSCSSSADSRHQRGRLRTLLARACFAKA